MSIRKSTLKGSKILEAPIVNPNAPPAEGNPLADGGLAQESPPEPEPNLELEPEPELEPDPNPIVYFDITIGDTWAGRIWFELFKNVVPKTAENFRGLCTAEYGVGASGSCRWYRGCELFRIVPGFCIQGGDFVRNNGYGGESIYGELFDDENFDLKHDAFGMMSMANENKPHTNGSQFIITLGPCPQLDGRHVVFGKVIKGEDVVRKIEQNGRKVRGCPKLVVKIKNCGQMPLNTEGDPSRPNFLQGRILAEAPKWQRMDLPKPSMYLPSIWRRRNNSVSPEVRRKIKDLQIYLKKTEDLRPEIFPRKKMFIAKRRPSHAICTQKMWINPFSMERNLSYRWKISPYAQLDHDKPLRPYKGTSEVPDEKLMRRLSNLMLGVGSKLEDFISPAEENGEPPPDVEVEKPPTHQTFDFVLAVTGDKKRNTMTPRRFTDWGIKPRELPEGADPAPPPA